mmetsp:Transcript_62147/g.161507  ORF Transcript_62147/g.161507 Transcript_62147/m.161507 type:complete len:237 (+) Transcript_62147:484-1194(+)
MGWPAVQRKVIIFLRNHPSCQVALFLCNWAHYLVTPLVGEVRSLRREVLGLRHPRGQAAAGVYDVGGCHAGPSLLPPMVRVEPHLTRQSRLPPDRLPHAIVHERRADHRSRNTAYVRELFECFGLDHPTCPPPSAPSEALDLQRVVHKLRHLLDLVVEVGAVRNDTKLGVALKYLQAAPILLLGLLRRVVAARIVAAGPPLVVPLHGARHHVHHEVVAGEQRLLRPGLVTRQAEDL